MYTPEEWIARAQALGIEHQRLSDADDMTCRSALLSIYRLFKNAPSLILDAYSLLPEAVLAKEAVARTDSVTAGNFDWLSPKSSSLDQWVLAAGAQARALDKVLISSAQSHQGHTHPSEWFCATNKAYAIPRSRPRQEEGDREWGRFTRRGILHHRILPEVLDAGYQIEIVRQDTTAFPISGEITMGAAFLPNIQLDLSSADRRFQVLGATYIDGPQTVTRQLGSAYDDGCFAIVWPELTVTPELRGHIAQFLKQRILSGDERKSLQIIVAGSFHEKDGDLTSNIAYVFDGYGNEKLKYRKQLRYHDEKKWI